MVLDAHQATLDYRRWHRWNLQQLSIPVGLLVALDLQAGDSGQLNIALEYLPAGIEHLCLLEHSMWHDRSVGVVLKVRLDHDRLARTIPGTIGVRLQRDLSRCAHETTKRLVHISHHRCLVLGPIDVDRTDDREGLLCSIIKRPRYLHLALEKVPHIAVLAFDRGGEAAAMEKRSEVFVRGSSSLTWRAVRM